MRRIDDNARRDAWRIASALLRYPDAELIAALPAIRAAAAKTARPHRKPLLTLIDGWLERPALEVQSAYVAVFDLDRRNSLYLSWHQYGDRRQRGMVLLKLKRRYQEHGLTPIEAELPDWLPLMLEFAAAAPAPYGVELLQQWRAPIELVRRSLRAEACEYAIVLDLVAATLPKLGANVRAAVDKLLADGPPDEEVGLEPFGPDNDLPSAVGAAGIGPGAAGGGALPGARPR